MTAPSLRTCVVACAVVGEPCDARGVAGRCEEGLNGPVCRPSARCIASARNAACPTSGCVGRYSLCAEVGAPVCLSRCERDSDCENAFARCRVVPLRGGGSARACVADAVIGPDQCGRAAVNDRGIGAPCDPSCASGLSCERGLAAGGAPFCTVACRDSSECGPNARCAMISGTQKCVPDDCSPFETRADSMLDRALTAAMRTRSELFYSRTDLDAFGTNVTRDRFRLPIFSRVHRDWMAGGRWARDVGPALDARATSLSGALASAAGLRADGSVASVALPAPVSSTATLAAAIVALDRAAGGTLEPAAASAAITTLPEDLQRALAPVFTAMADALRARDAGVLAPLSMEERERYFGIAPRQILAGFDGFDPRNGRDLGVILGDVALPVESALALARTIESISWASFRGRMIPPVLLSTAAGAIVVRGSGADRYEGAELAQVAFALDLGGDDEYLAPVAANQSYRNGVSVAIDVDGQDRYGYVEVPHSLDALGFLAADQSGRDARSRASRSDTFRQGAARFGVALLYDFGTGSDRYRSLRGSQGFAALGVGGLYDEGGDDEYSVEAGGQGAAVLGVAALVDASGADQYTAWTFAQGFGYVRGVGILYDRDGADRFVARETPVAYPSPQNPMVNTSFSQGAGFGRRADSVDNINMSGGLGVLRDRAGGDRYAASIFGQATGYWGGMGLLLDGAGDDEYDGRWYVQAGTAHFAYAALVDGGGRDVHNMTASRQNMTAGAGHDFSVSFFFADGAEADTYNVPNLALGAGNANGAGFFAEQGGDDVYRAASPLSLGNAAYENLMDTGRLMRRTWGVFLDGAGTDTFDRTMLGPVRNDATWTQRIHDTATNETGIGADGDAPLGL